MSPESILPYIAGPGGAIAICVLVGWGIYRLLVHYAVPLMQGAVDRHLAQVDAMNERHEAQHQAILKRCEAGFERVNTDITKVCITLDSMAAK